MADEARKMGLRKIANVDRERGWESRRGRGAKGKHDETKDFEMKKEICILRSRNEWRGKRG